MNWFRKHFAFLSITSLFASVVVFFYFFFSSQVVTKKEPTELIPSNSSWILIFNESKLSGLDQLKLDELTGTHFPLESINAYFKEQSVLKEMNCWVFQSEGKVFFILPDCKNEKAILQLKEKLGGLKFVQLNDFIIFSTHDYTPIAIEQSIHSDASFTCIYEKKSSDARLSLIMKNVNSWELWEQFNRSGITQLTKISCSTSERDSLTGSFQAIADLPGEAMDLHARHFGNGQLLLDVSLEEADSSLKKIFLEREIEHESFLGESFNNWFHANATGECGSFRIQNLGSERIYFLGINESSSLKWMTDSSAQTVRSFPLGGRLAFGYPQKEGVSYFAFIQNEILFFSSNASQLQGLKDYLKISSKIQDLKKYNSMPVGGELIVRPEVESNLLMLLGAGDAWFHGTREKGYVKWIQLCNSELRVKEEVKNTEPIAIDSVESELIFAVENHLSSAQNEIRCSGNKLKWIENGNQRFEFECKSEIRSVTQIDQLGNGKLQLLILTQGGVDLCDVNGKRMAGFPIAIPAGTTGVWKVVQNRKPDLCRILVASGSNEIYNLRVNGQSATGWQKTRFESEIKSIQDVSEGYLIELANGSSKKIKKTGIQLK
jgi:hypothetical protein